VTDRDNSEQLNKYLADVHSIEHQALAQMRTAPDIAGDPQLQAAFRRHLTETEAQERRVAECLEARDAKPSRLKDVVGEATGKAFVLFARSQPDTPGKLVAHAFSYEHMEAAAYELLEIMAQRAGDVEAATMAYEIGAEERAMAATLERLFDVAAEASLRGLDPEELNAQVAKYLSDAHAIENQAIALLDRAPDITGPPELARACEEHLRETREHQRLVTERLEQGYGAHPSRLKDAAMRLGALNWGAFFAAQPDTPAKLAGFAYAFEHLEIAAYELLRRVADRAGDGETVTMAERILAEERAAAERLHSLFPAALEESLQELGVSA
jgi:ferritin-like metal-binding protein YciE